jgi:hypothetical protein
MLASRFFGGRALGIRRLVPVKQIQNEDWHLSMEIVGTYLFAHMISDRVRNPL